VRPFLLDDLKSSAGIHAGNDPVDRKGNASTERVETQIVGFIVRRVVRTKRSSAKAAVAEGVSGTASLGWRHPT
jgi:hypothetical protein